MDRPAIEELFAYTDFAWRQYAETTRGLGGDALAKAVPGSGWPALRNAFGHVLIAYDGWMAELTDASRIGLNVESVRSWDDLDSYRRQVRGRFREHLNSLNDAELSTRRPMMGMDDEPLSNSPADILTNLLLHERGHHGDISTLLYQLGAEPPSVDYRFFLLEVRP